jgi:hypothetical protein
MLGFVVHVEGQMISSSTAWGLRLDCPRVEPAMLLAGPMEWPEVTIDIDTGVGRPEPGSDWCDAQRAEVGLSGGGRATLDRATLSSRLIFPEMPSADAIVHPHLASTATIMNWWLGRNCFHAGAFELDGRTWGLLGDRGDGKSSSLAWLHARGVPIVTDDVLAVAGDRAFAGPRCLDLRQEAADRLGVGRYLGVVGNRERWRIDLHDVASEGTLGGWIFLDWAESTALTRLSPSEVLGKLVPFLAVGLLPDPTELLRLATMPSFVWSRPRSWDSMPSAVSVLISTLAGMPVH